MNESFCAALMVVLVPLVTGLNAVGIAMMRSIQAELGRDRSPRRDS